MAVAAASAVIFGLAPALRAARLDVQSTLRAMVAGWARSATACGPDLSQRRLRLPSCCSTVPGCSFAVQSTSTRPRLASIRPGCLRLDSISGIDLRRSRSCWAGFRPDGDRLRAESGVREAAVTSHAPMGAGQSSNGLVPEGRTLEAKSSIDAWFRMVSPNYLAVMRIPLISGRTFTRARCRQCTASHDREPHAGRTGMAGAGSRRKARGVLRGQLAGPEVEDGCRSGGRHSVGRAHERAISRVLHADGPGAASGLGLDPTYYDIRGSNRVDAAGPATAIIQHAVRSVDPALPIYDVATMHQAMRTSTAEHRFDTMLPMVLALVGLVLAAAGIASVVAFFVTARTHEIGVRLALGATSGEILVLFARQSAAPILLGVVSWELRPPWPPPGSSGGRCMV